MHNNPFKWIDLLIMIHLFCVLLGLAVEMRFPLRQWKVINNSLSVLWDVVNQLHTTAEETKPSSLMFGVCLLQEFRWE